MQLNSKQTQRWSHLLCSLVIVLPNPWLDPQGQAEDTFCVTVNYIFEIRREFWLGDQSSKGTSIALWNTFISSQSNRVSAFVWEHPVSNRSNINQR